MARLTRNTFAHFQHDRDYLAWLVQNRPRETAEAVGITLPRLMQKHLEGLLREQYPTIDEIDVFDGARKLLYDGIDLDDRAAVERALRNPYAASDPSIVDPGARVLAGVVRGTWNAVAPPYNREKTYCNRVGTDPNGILPIGVPSSDGLVTSTPPFEPSPFVDSNPPFTACSPVRCITDERMTRMVKLFTTAFWKAYLLGDQRYNQFLTPDYSNQEPEAIIISEGVVSQ